MQDGYYGSDALISLNGIANDDFDISANGGPDFYTGYNDYIYGFAGNDYLFGGVDRMTAFFVGCRLYNYR